MDNSIVIYIIVLLKIYDVHKSIIAEPKLIYYVKMHSPKIARTHL